MNQLVTLPHDGSSLSRLQAGILQYLLDADRRLLARVGVAERVRL